MPTFTFYASVGETKKALVAALSGKNLRFLPARNYSSKTPSYFDKLGPAFWSDLRNRQFYVIGEFTIEPINFSEIAGTFCVSQPSSGPLIEVCLPAIPQENGLSKFRIGLIAYHPAFWTADFKRKYPPPESLVNAYKDILKSIKSFIKRKKTGDLSVWIGNEAYDAFLNARGVVEVNGKLIGTTK